MRTAAILPVKRFARAKQRLGASVTESLRAELARAMVSDVLAALAEARAIEATIVVTRRVSPSKLELTRLPGRGRSTVATIGAMAQLAEPGSTSSASDHPAPTTAPMVAAWRFLPALP